MSTPMWLHKAVQKGMGRSPNKVYEGDDYVRWSWWLTASGISSVTVMRTTDVDGFPIAESLCVQWTAPSGAGLSVQGFGKLGVAAAITAYIDMRSVGLTTECVDDVMEMIATHLEPGLWASVEEKYA